MRRVFAAAVVLGVALVFGLGYLCADEGGTPVEVEAGAAVRVAYLTFDDGPSPRTEEILAMLDKKGVKATFFVTSAENEEYHDWIGAIAEAGHDVGIHCGLHDPGRIYGSLEGFVRDFERVEQVVEEQLGRKTSLYRFPGGSRSYRMPKWLQPQLLDWLEGRGYIYYDWNAVSGDDTATVYPAATLARNILRAAEGKEELVALFHDTSISTTTAEAAGMVVDALLEQGWRFDVLSAQVVPVQFP